VRRPGLANHWVPVRTNHLRSGKAECVSRSTPDNGKDE
jgi:hypothetical protein